MLVETTDEDAPAPISVSSATYALQELALLFAGADQKEGMSAFLDKRTPHFGGE